MKVQVEVVQCANHLATDYITNLPVSNYSLCVGFTRDNFDFSRRELNKVGPIAEAVVAWLVEFREVRIIFVSGCRLTVVLRKDYGRAFYWGYDNIVGAEQVARLIEKAFDETGEDIE